VSLSGLPPKSNFKFQELPAITGVKPYVLRFWESEFPEIRPVTDEAGEKRYARVDVETILRIKELLFDRKMSIAEAQMVVRDGKTPEEREELTAETDPLLPLQEAMEFLREVRRQHGW